MSDVQSITVQVPGPVQSITVSTGLRGPKGEDGSGLGGTVDTTARATASQALALAKSAHSTSCLRGGTLSIGADHQSINIGAGLFRFVDNYTDPLNPVVVEVEAGPWLSVPDPYLTITTSTIVGVQLVAGVVTPLISESIISTSATRDVVQLGGVAHFGGYEVLAYSQPYNDIDVYKKLVDLCRTLGLMTTSGNVYGPTPFPSMMLTKTGGVTFGSDLNAENSRKDPDFVVDPTLSAGQCILMPSWQMGDGTFTTGAPTVTVDPDHWDADNGILTAVPDGEWTIQALWWFPLVNLTGIVYGQIVYATSADALAHIQDPTNVDPSVVGATFRGWLIVQQGATNLQVSAGQAIFRPAGKFGIATIAGGGGGGEVNTASNINSRGTGVYIQKYGVDLEFAGIDSADPLINVGFDIPTQAILVSTNIHTGTGDPPGGLPDGSIYFKIS